MEFPALLWSFFKIRVISFGGGWTVVGVIKSETVPRWIDAGAFSSLIAIAHATPGPVALNATTLVGWRTFGWLGAIASTTAVVLFPALAIALAGVVGKRIRLHADSLKESPRSGTLAMMIMTLWFLLPKDNLDPILVILGVAGFALTAFTKINPLWAIFGAAAINMILSLLGWRASHGYSGDRCAPVYGADPILHRCGYRSLDKAPTFGVRFSPCLFSE